MSDYSMITVSSPDTKILLRKALSAQIEMKIKTSLPFSLTFVRDEGIPVRKLVPCTDEEGGWLPHL
jgi:hypothetical protein